MRGAFLLGLAAIAACGPTVQSTTGEAGTPATSESPAPGAKAQKPGRGPAVSYQQYTGTRALLVHQLDSLTFQLPGGSDYVQTFGRSVYLSLQLSAAAAGSHVVIAVDSIRLDPGQASLPIPFDSIRAAEGARWTADLPPTGRLTNLTASDSSLLAAQLGGDLQRIFPIIPAGGVKAGAAWNDTSSTVIATSVLDTRRTGWWQYRGIGFQQDAGTGARGFQIEATDSFTQSGTGNQFGTTIQMKGQGTGTASWLLADDGWPIRGSSTTHFDLMLTNPSVGQSVPAKAANYFTIESRGAGH